MKGHAPQQEYFLCNLCSLNTYITDIKLCHDCNLDICSQCAVKHSENPTFCDHKVEAKIHIFCHTHRLTCTYYCVRCEDFMCVACINNENKCAEHHQDRKPMVDIKAEKVKEIQNLKKKMNADFLNLTKEGDSFLALARSKLHNIQDIRQLLTLHVTKLVRHVKDKEGEMMNMLEDLENDIINKEQHVQSLVSSKCVIGSELEQCADEGSVGGLQELMTTVSLLKSYMPPRVDLLMDTLPSYICFKPKDLLTIGEIISDTRIHTLGVSTNSLNETPNKVPITSGVEAMAFVDKSAKPVYTDQNVSTNEMKEEPNQTATGYHNLSVADMTETLTVLTDITPGASQVKRKRNRNRNHKKSSLTSKDQISDDTTLSVCNPKKDECHLHSDGRETVEVGNKKEDSSHALIENDDKEAAGITQTIKKLIVADEAKAQSTSVSPTGIPIDWSTNKSPKKLWERKGLQDGRDVIFLPSGNIVITLCGDDWLESKNVLLYSNDGKIITTSKKQEVELEGAPWGLTYDPLETAVIVADYRERLTFLDPSDLHLIRRIHLESPRGIKSMGVQENGQCPSGVFSVGVLSDGRLVVRTQFNQFIGIYDRRGRYISKILVEKGLEQRYLNFIGVLPGDIIVVNMLSKNKILFLASPRGKWLMHEVRVLNPINLSVNQEGDVLLVNSFTVLCLSGHVGKIKKHTVLEFDYGDCHDVGPPLAVAMQGRQLVVLWKTKFSLYQLE